MALNFPNSPTNGQKYTDPNGTPWVYETATNSWTAGSTLTGGMVYKGGLNITATPPTGAVSGWTYSVTTGGTANAGFTGLTGNIPQGSQIIFDGTNWQQITIGAPSASETVKGIVELATAAETTTGTDATKAVHPQGLKVELDKKAPKTITSDTAPANPVDGQLWYDSVGRELCVWYDSDDAGAALGTWVQANPQAPAPPAPPQATASVAGIDVKLWKKTGATLEPETAGTGVALGGSIVASASVAGGLAVSSFNGSTDPAAYSALQLKCGTSEWDIGAKNAANVNTPNGLTFGYNGTTYASFFNNGHITFGTSFTERTGVVNVASADQHHFVARHTAAAVGKFWSFSADGTNSLKIVNNGSSGVFMADGSNSWGTLSDERAKGGLQPIKNGLDKVAALRSVTGHYINDEHKKSQSFLIAQDVQAVLPEAVSVIDESGFLGLRYTDVIPLLVAALKESKERIEALETRIATLEARP
jgi:hypothetical protein